MKTKLLLLILLIVGSVGQGLAAGENNAKMRPPVKVIIKLLKARTGCSEPRGLCLAFENDYTFRNSDPTITNGYMTYSSNILSIEVPKMDISESGSKALQGYSTLPIDENLSLPPNLCTGLGATSTLIIRVGEYPIREMIDKYIITIPCK